MWSLFITRNLFSELRHFKEKQKYLNIRGKNLSWEIVTKVTSPKYRGKNFFHGKIYFIFFYQINRQTVQWSQKTKFYFLQFWRYSKTLSKYLMFWGYLIVLDNTPKNICAFLKSNFILALVFSLTCFWCRKWHFTNSYKVIKKYIEISMKYYVLKINVVREQQK